MSDDGGFPYHSMSKLYQNNSKISMVIPHLFCMDEIHVLQRICLQGWLKFLWSSLLDAFLWWWQSKIRLMLSIIDTRVNYTGAAGAWPSIYIIILVILLYAILFIVLYFLFFSQQPDSQWHVANLPIQPVHHHSSIRHLPSRGLGMGRTHQQTPLVPCQAPISSWR